MNVQKSRATPMAEIGELSVLIRNVQKDQNVAKEMEDLDVAEMIAVMIIDAVMIVVAEAEEEVNFKNQKSVKYLKFLSNKPDGGGFRRNDRNDRNDRQKQDKPKQSDDGGSWRRGDTNN